MFGTMPVDTYREVKTTFQEAAKEDNASVIKSHGERQILFRRGEAPVELAAMRKTTLTADDLESLAAIIKRRWPDAADCPTVFVAKEFIEARLYIPVRNVMVDCDDSNGNADGYETVAILNTKYGKVWNDLKEFLTEKTFTTREAITYRAKLAAWLSPSDLARWYNDFRNLTKRVTSEQTTVGIGTVGRDMKMSEKLEVTTGDGVDISWFDGLDFSAKLYDWSPEPVTVRAMITEGKDPEKWIARAIGNALEDAELRS